MPALANSAVKRRRREATNDGLAATLAMRPPAVRADRRPCARSGKRYRRTISREPRVCAVTADARKRGAFGRRIQTISGSGCSSTPNRSRTPALDALGERADLGAGRVAVIDEDQRVLARNARIAFAQALESARFDEPRGRELRESIARRPGGQRVMLALQRFGRALSERADS